MKPSVILFGASKAGKQTLEAIKHQVNIIAFSDNDINKHGQQIQGIPIIDPIKIPQMKIDGIIISSMYASEISQQLIQLGIPAEQIHTQWSHSLSTRPLFPWDAVLFIILFLMVIYIILYSLLN